MSYAEQMMATNPSRTLVDADTLALCIEACLDCADVCAATGAVLSRETEPSEPVIRAVLQACVASCSQCAATCEGHAEHGMEHCRLCAEACRRCEGACNDVLSQMGA